MKELPILPNGYRAAKLDDGWYIIDGDGSEIMGPFKSKELALDAYSEGESWDC
jgi:hypothetical protein